MSVDLLTQEREVLDVVQQYLSHNRQFDIEDIVPYINYYLRRTSNKLNYQGIKSILHSLVRKGFLVEGSKLTKEDILNNETRKIIYECIVNNPGVYFTKIVKELGISNHVGVWHLSMLIKFNFIKKRIVNRHEIYFDSKVSFLEAKFRFYLSFEKSKMIIDYLRSNNTGITKTKLSKALKMHLNTLSKYLNILVKITLINEEKIDNQILYFLEEKYLTQSN
jgi:predicted transcriptional regulator